MRVVKYSFVAEMVSASSRPGGRSLDIGAGACAYRGEVRGTYVGLDLPGSYYGEHPDVFADGEHLPFREQTFDLVFGVGVFYLVPDARRCFTECRRVLDQDGVFLAFGYQPGVARRHRASNPMHRHVWSFDELAHELRAAGFSSVVDRSGVDAAWRHTTPSRFAVRQARRLAGREGTWLIAEARP